MGSECPARFGLDANALLRLRLEEALSSRYHAVQACSELALLLRCCYAQSPKPVQSLLFTLSLRAIGTLLLLDGKLLEGGVRLVAQAADAVLPSQRRAQARREYKQAGIERRRRTEQHQRKEPPDLPPLPPDVVHHMFGFLDMASLARASAVCASWSDAARHQQEAWGAHAASLRPLLHGRGCAARTPQDCSGFEEFAALARCASPGEFLSNRVLCRDCGSILWVHPRSARELQNTGPQRHPSWTPTADGTRRVGTEVLRMKRQCLHDQWRMADSAQVILCLAGHGATDSESDDSDSDSDTTSFRLWRKITSS